MSREPRPPRLWSEPQTVAGRPDRTYRPSTDPKAPLLEGRSLIGSMLGVVLPSAAAGAVFFGRWDQEEAATDPPPRIPPGPGAFGSGVLDVGPPPVERHIAIIGGPAPSDVRPEQASVPVGRETRVDASATGLGSRRPGRGQASPVPSPVAAGGGMGRTAGVPFTPVASNAADGPGGPIGPVGRNGGAGGTTPGRSPAAAAAPVAAGDGPASSPPATSWTTATAADYIAALRSGDVLRGGRLSGRDGTALPSVAGPEGLKPVPEAGRLPAFEVPEHWAGIGPDPNGDGLGPGQGGTPEAADPSIDAERAPSGTSIVAAPSIPTGPATSFGELRLPGKLAEAGSATDEDGPPATASLGGLWAGDGDTTEAGGLEGESLTTADGSEAVPLGFAGGALAAGADRPVGGGAGGLIARALRQREGVPFDAPGEGTPGGRDGADLAFEVLDSLIIRYIDHVLEGYSGTTSGDFTVDQEGADPLGTYAFSATVSYERDETTDVVNDVFTADNVDSYSYMFVGSGTYADGTGYTLYDHGSAVASAVGTGQVAERTLTGTLDGWDDYTLIEDGSHTVAGSGGGAAASADYGLSVRHEGDSTFALDETRTEAHGGGSVTAGRQDYAWSESNQDTLAATLTGVQVATESVGGSSQSTTLGIQAGRTGDQTLELAAAETFGAGGALTGGDRHFTWTADGSGGSTRSEEATWSVADAAGGGSLDGTLTATLTSSGSTAATLTVTDGFAASGNDAAFTWTAAGTVGYTAGEVGTQTGSMSASESVAAATGTATLSFEGVESHAYTATTTLAGGTFELRHEGGHALSDGVIASGDDLYTYESRGDPEQSLTLAGGRTADVAYFTSSTMAHGEFTHFGSGDEEADYTHTLRSTGDESYRSTSLWASEILGEFGVITGGTVVRSAHEQGGYEAFDRVDATATDASTANYAWGAGGLSASETASATWIATYGSTGAVTGSATIDVEESADLGLGAAILGGSATGAASDQGTGGVTWTATGTDTSGSTTTLTQAFGGLWTSATLSAGGSVGLSSGTTLTDADFAVTSGSSLGLGAGGVVTGGTMSWSRHETGARSAHNAEDGTASYGGSTTMTYREGGFFATGASSYGTDPGVTLGVAAARAGTLTLDAEGEAALGAGGIPTGGHRSATYIEQLGPAWGTNTIAYDRDGDVTSGWDTTATLTVGGLWSSSDESGDDRLTHDAEGSVTVSHSLSHAQVVAFGSGGAITGGSADATFIEDGTGVSNSIFGSLFASSSGSSTLTQVEGPIEADSWTSATFSHSRQSADTATGGSYRLAQEAGSVLGAGGAAASGNGDATYHEESGVVLSSLHDVAGWSDSATAGLTQRLGDDTLIDEATAGGSGSSTTTLTAEGVQTLDQTAAFGLGPGGTITHGVASSTIDADGGSTLSVLESGTSTGGFLSQATLIEGGHRLERSGDGSTTLTFGSDLRALTTSQLDRRAEVTFGLNGSLLEGGATTTYREQADADTLALDQTLSSTLADSMSRWSTLDEATSTESSSADSTVTDELTVSSSGGRTFDQTVTEGLGVGGTVTLATADGTLHASGQETRSAAHRGQVTADGRDWTSLSAGQDVTTASETFSGFEHRDGTSSRTVVVTLDRTDSLTLGVGGVISSGGGETTLVESSGDGTFDELRDGWRYAESDHNRTVHPPPEQVPRNDVAEVTITAEFTGTAHGGDSYESAQTIEEAVGTGGTIVAGSVVGLLHAEGDEEAWTEDTFGEETRFEETRIDGGVATTKYATLDLVESTFTSGGDYTLDQSGTESRGVDGVVTGGLATLDYTQASGGDSTFRATGSEQIFSGGITKTGSATVSRGDGHGGDLSQSSTLTIGAGGAITSGSREHEGEQTLTYSHDLSRLGTQINLDAATDDFLTAFYDDSESGDGTISSAESGAVALGSDGSITGGDARYTWHERRSADRVEHVVPDASLSTMGDLRIGALGTETFALDETGTETLGTGGDIVSGWNTYTWDQGGGDGLTLHQVGAGDRDFTLDLVDVKETSWHDIGTDELGAAARVMGGTDDYVASRGRSIWMNVVDRGTSGGLFPYAIAGEGTDTFGLAVAGQLTRTLTNDLPAIQESGDSYTWIEGSSNAAQFTRSWGDGVGWARTMRGNGHDSYAVTRIGTVAESAGESTSSDTFTVSQLHDVVGEIDGWEQPDSSSSMEYDAWQEWSHTLEATGGSAEDAAGRRESLSFDTSNKGDWHNEISKSHDDGATSYEVEQVDHRENHFASQGWSTLSEAWSSFSSTHSSEQTLSDSQTGYIDDYQASGGGYQAIDYTSDGYFNTNRSMWGGSGQLTHGPQSFDADSTSTGYYNDLIGDLVLLDLREHYSAESAPTVMGAFGTPMGNGGAIHLGSGLGEEDDVSPGPLPGNLLEFAGNLVTRNLIIDVSPSHDRLRAELDLATSYRLVEGDGLWSGRPAVTVYDPTGGEDAGGGGGSGGMFGFGSGGGSSGGGDSGGGDSGGSSGGGSSGGSEGPNNPYLAQLDALEADFGAATLTREVGQGAATPDATRQVIASPQGDVAAPVFSIQAALAVAAIGYVGESKATDDGWTSESLMQAYAELYGEEGRALLAKALIDGITITSDNGKNWKDRWYFDLGNKSIVLAEYDHGLPYFAPKLGAEAAARELHEALQSRVGENAAGNFLRGAGNISSLHRPEFRGLLEELDPATGQSVDNGLAYLDAAGNGALIEGRNQLTQAAAGWAFGRILRSADDIVGGGVGAHGPSRKVALGIEGHLDEFARANGAESWKQFAKADPMQWKFHFLDVMNDPNAEVLFNLKGVDVWEGVGRASRGAGGATDWELLQIMQNKEWWPRIKWMKDGVQVPNPFDD